MDAKRIRCTETACMHHRGDCRANNIEVSVEDGEAMCTTFQHVPAEVNTAQERMMGTGNGTIGDGELTVDYMRTEFSAPLSETVANAEITCTASHCVHNSDYVCKAGKIDIGSPKRGYRDTHCAMYKTKGK